MYRKILLCTDLSDASDALLSCVEELKPLGLEEVILGHVIYVAHSVGLEEALAKEAKPALDRQNQRLQEQGLKVSVETPMGIPHFGLLDLAEKHDVSIILIGSHGKGIFKQAVMGSVASELLGIATKPVLLIRVKLLSPQGRCASSCEKILKHILFPTDFSDTANRAFIYLKKLVAATKCRGTLLHVQEQIKPHLILSSEQANQEGYERLQEMKAELEQFGASQVEVEITSGIPKSVILQKANDDKFSLIIMGRQGNGFLGDVLLGSVSMEVVRKATLPILLIPAT